MKSATVKELKDELATRSQKELLELCLQLSKFKKENKELLTYLLYEASNEELFVEGIKKEMDGLFSEINTSGFYLIKKSVRKILRIAKKYIRYSKQKETEVQLLIHFCSKLKSFNPSIKGSLQLQKLYDREIASIIKTVSSMHEDLQFDYREKINTLAS